MKKLWMSGFNLRAHLGDARLKVTLVAAMALFTLVPCFSAMAQEDDTFMLEEITVTGSRIRGVEGVGTSVVGIDREDMTISAGTSVDLIIKELPSVMNLGISEVSRQQSGGAKNNTQGSAINIHGIGPYATLTLLDGHRVASNGKFVSPGVFPSMGIERIEVVADGASAIYGSDAIAGVVNIIPRRNLDGVETSIRIGSAADMDTQWQAGAAVGKLWDSGQFMVAYEHSFRGRLNGDDRDFYRSDLTPWGGNDYRVTNSSPGTIRAGGRGTAYAETTFAIPEEGVTPATADLLVPGTVNLFDPVAGKDLLPEQEYDNTNFTFNQKVNNIEFFADGFYSERKFNFYRQYESTNLVVPSTNAFFVPLPGMAGLRSYTVDFNYADLGQPPNSHVGSSKNWEITPGFRMDLPHGFQFEALYTYGQSRDFSSYEGAPARPTRPPQPPNATDVALASSDPATALDLWGLGRTTAETIAAMTTGFMYAPLEANFQGFEASVNGPVLDLPGGTLSIAAGYEAQRWEARTGQQRGDYPEPENIPWIPWRKRDVDSVYVELYVPVFGQKNATTGINRLELTAALRYDEYSDVGGTTNPKLGFNYSPIEPLMFHGSYGTSFRAPLIDDYQPPEWILLTARYPDPDNPAAPPVSGYKIMGGNEDLEPEEATNWSLGADYKITEDTDVSLAYFSIDYDKQINSYLSHQNMLSIKDEFTGMDVIWQGDAAAEKCIELAAMGVEPGAGGWSGGGPEACTLLVDGRPMNLGLSVTRGLDFMVSHNLRTDTLGSFRFKLDGTYIVSYEIAYTSDGTKFDYLNEIYNPLRLKARGSVTWDYEPFMTQVAFRYVNEYDNTTVSPVETIDSYMPVDILVRFNGDNVGWLGSFGTGLSISLEARNAFDIEPPYVNVGQTRDGGGGFDETAADPVGRLIALSVRKKF